MTLARIFFFSKDNLCFDVEFLPSINIKELIDILIDSMAKSYTLVNC